MDQEQQIEELRNFSFDSATHNRNFDSRTFALAHNDFRQRFDAMLARRQVIRKDLSEDEVSRDGDRAVYVAEIPGKAPGKGYVTSHYHPKLDGGTEWYHVIEAHEGAVMCTGKPKLEEEKVVDVEWDTPASIKTGDFFIVPNGTVHSLVSGKERLRFVFGCPDAHLDNNRDKVVLEDFLPSAYT